MANIAYLREQAQRCRRVARDVGATPMSRRLATLALHAVILQAVASSEK
jgi:hypothetical protein